MTWTISIFLSVACLSLHILSVKVLGEKFPSSFVTPAFYTFAILVLYGLFAYEKPVVQWGEIFRANILLPLILAGVTIGLTDYFFVKSINLGAAVSMAMSILLGGATVLVAIMGFLLFKEQLNAIKLIGISMAVVGIYLIYRE